MVVCMRCAIHSARPPSCPMIEHDIHKGPRLQSASSSLTALTGVRNLVRTPPPPPPHAAPLLPAANGGCLNLWGAIGPSVGIYQCVVADNNDWTYDAGAQHLVSAQDGSCLTASSTPSGSQFMVSGRSGQVRSDVVGHVPCLCFPPPPCFPTCSRQVNEFGNGELTLFGAFVTDVCVAAC
jgi:hypothetical protein